jgi:hypothetical protein
VAGEHQLHLLGNLYQEGTTAERPRKSLRTDGLGGKMAAAAFLKFRATRIFLSTAAFAIVASEEKWK